MIYIVCSFMSISQWKVSKTMHTSVMKNDWEANQAICVSSEFEKYI